MVGFANHGSIFRDIHFGRSETLTKRANDPQKQN